MLSTARRSDGQSQPDQIRDVWRGTWLGRFWCTCTQQLEAGRARDTLLWAGDNGKPASAAQTVDSKLFQLWPSLPSTSPCHSERAAQAAPSALHAVVPLLHTSVTKSLTFALAATSSITL
eukprot:1699608-Rhodomonas_salina.9